MLSRKYYRTIAKTIKDNTLVNNGMMLPTVNKTNLVSDLCKVLKEDNSLFDRNRFINACDVVDD